MLGMECRCAGLNFEIIEKLKGNIFLVEMPFLLQGQGGNILRLEDGKKDKGEDKGLVLVVRSKPSFSHLDVFTPPESNSTVNRGSVLTKR